MGRFDRTSRYIRANLQSDADFPENSDALSRHGIAVIGRAHKRLQAKVPVTGQVNRCEQKMSSRQRCHSPQASNPFFVPGGIVRRVSNPSTTWNNAISRG